MKKNKAVILFAIIIILVMGLSLVGVIDENIGMCVSLGLVVIFNLIVAVMAFKSDVKLITVLMVLFAIVGSGLLALNIYSIVNPIETVNPEFNLIVSSEESEKTKLFTLDGKTYYTYNLGSVKVAFKDGDTYTLESAMKDSRVSLDDILSLAIPNDKEDGYTIYYDGGESGVANDEYSIVICDNSGDIIFAPYSYSYEESICK